MKSNFDSVLIELAYAAASRIDLCNHSKIVADSGIKYGYRLTFLSDNDRDGYTKILIPPHKLVVIKHKNMLKYLQENRGCLNSIYSIYPVSRLTWREFDNEDVENIMYINI